MGSYAIAIIMCLITMICWDSWANTTKLVSDKRWEFLLFYWDYPTELLLCSLLFAFALGSMGEAGRSFMPDTRQANSSNLMSVMLAGIVFNISNILPVTSINLADMAVASSVGVGLALALGVITIYVNGSQGNPFILFLGVTCVVIAIVFAAVTYGRVTQEANRSRRSKGFITVILTDVIMGWFFRFLTDSILDSFSQPASSLTTPYLALVLFAVGLSLSNFVLNTLVMKKPILGESVNGKMYFSGGLRDHVCGWLGGMIRCVGLAFNLIVSGQVRYTISYGLEQGVTMITAIWEVFIWREFANTSTRTNKLLPTMFVSCIVDIVLIIAANQ